MIGCGEPYVDTNGRADPRPRCPRYAYAGRAQRRELAAGSAIKLRSLKRPARRRTEASRWCRQASRMVQARRGGGVDRKRGRKAPRRMVRFSAARQRQQSASMARYRRVGLRSVSRAPCRSATVSRRLRSRPRHVNGQHPVASTLQIHCGVHRQRFRRPAGAVRRRGGPLGAHFICSSSSGPPCSAPQLKSRSPHRFALQRPSRPWERLATRSQPLVR